MAVDVQALDEAARLAKTDLTTELVKEFTELQGIVGGLYARAQGVSEPAAIAIYDQYRPQGMDDGSRARPRGRCWRLRTRPTRSPGCLGWAWSRRGSKDPFALRRAAQRHREDPGGGRRCRWGSLRCGGGCRGGQGRAGRAHAGVLRASGWSSTCARHAGRHTTWWRR